MITNKDHALVDFIVSSTEKGAIRWESRADNAFVASLRGDHTVSVENHEHSPDALFLRNRAGEIILRIDASDYHPVGRLFELARRNAYDVDNVIDEIMGGEPAPKPDTRVTDEDIPF